jgi:N-acetylglucosamine kinase-like BadF-type ATPase
LSGEYLLALEGGGTRSQAALLDEGGIVLSVCDAADTNTNFVGDERARQVLSGTVQEVLQNAGVNGDEVLRVALSLVGPKFGTDILKTYCPNATTHYYLERDVVFARAGIFDHPHGIAVVAATGSTAWAVRADDGRQVLLGGWGSLLGDEGSAYALGLEGLRCAVQAYESRSVLPTRLVEAICRHFGLSKATFRPGLISLAYQKPLSRSEIARIAPVVTALAAQKDPQAEQITAKVAADLAELALQAARRLFEKGEVFDCVVAGGLVRAGDCILSALRWGLEREYPKATLRIGDGAPAVALGKIALVDHEEMV